MTARAGQRVEYLSHAHARAANGGLLFRAPPDAACSTCGPADETRHIVVRNEQAKQSELVDPSGVGTQANVIWGKVGENQVFDDMTTSRRRSSPDGCRRWALALEFERNVNGSVACACHPSASFQPGAVSAKVLWQTSTRN
jgi:hypothetical protein